MKKAIIASVILVGLLSLNGGVAYAAGQVAKRNAISEETACNFAYVDAGISPEEANVVKTEFDFEKGKFVYEIEFVANGVEYEYTVDSSNGKIIKRASERSSGVQSQAPLSPTEGEQAITAPQAQAGIGLDRAKEIALEMAGLSSRNDVVFHKEIQERENGRLVYSLSFHVPGEATYEYELDAESGTILEESFASLQDRVTPPPSAVTSGQTQQQAPLAAQTSIGIDQAKQIVLAKIGLSADQVVFSKAKLERDNGRHVYDIEFYVVGEAEYEFELDAETGTILDTGYEKWESAPAAEQAQPQATAKPAAPAQPQATAKPAAPAQPKPTAQPANPAPAAPSNSSGKAITPEQSQAVAMQETGVSAKDTTGHKTELDHENGRPVYEVEYTANGIEYEVDVDANTGSVVKVEAEPQDDDDHDDHDDRDDDYDDRDDDYDDDDDEDDDDDD